MLSVIHYILLFVKLFRSAKPLEANGNKYATASRNNISSMAQWLRVTSTRVDKFPCSSFEGCFYHIWHQMGNERSWLDVKIFARL